MISVDNESGNGEPMLTHAQQLDYYAFRAKYAERWITVGSGDEGGTPIKVDDKGKIVAGPKGMADKGIKKLSDFGKKPKAKPDEPGYSTLPESLIPASVPGMAERRKGKKKLKPEPKKSLLKKLADRLRGGDKPKGKPAKKAAPKKKPKPVKKRGPGGLQQFAQGIQAAGQAARVGAATVENVLDPYQWPSPV